MSNISSIKVGNVDYKINAEYASTCNKADYSEYSGCMSYGAGVPDGDDAFGLALILTDDGSTYGEQVCAITDCIEMTGGAYPIPVKYAQSLSTKRTIKAGLAVTSNGVSFDGSSDITIPINSVSESYITFGGKNFAGMYSPIDALFVGNLSADRFAFAPASCITVEYSTDNGRTWTDYGLSDWLKKGFFAGDNPDIIIGKRKANSSIALEKCLVRITIDFSAMPLYTNLTKFIFYNNVDGTSGSYVNIEIAPWSNPSSFNYISFHESIAGWPGYSVINVKPFIAYSLTSSASSYYKKIRFTFGCTGGDASCAGLTIYQIKAFSSDMAWSAPSDMARKGSLLSWDPDKNLTVPNEIITRGSSGNYTVRISPDNNFILIYRGSGSELTLINSTGITATGTVTAKSFVTKNGTSSLLVTGNGSLLNVSDISANTPIMLPAPVDTFIINEENAIYSFLLTAEKYQQINGTGMATDPCLLQCWDSGTTFMRANRLRENNSWTTARFIGNVNSSIDTCSTIVAWLSHNSNSSALYINFCWLGFTNPTSNFTPNSSQLKGNWADLGGE